MRVNGALLIDAILLGDFTSNGAIGLAPSTVDRCSFFEIEQATANISLTLPLPTFNSPALQPRSGRHCYVANTGTASFQMYGKTVDPGEILTLYLANGDWRTQAEPPITSVWTTVTADILAVADGQYKMMGDHELMFPASPTANATIRIIPGNSNWLALANTYATSDGATIAAGQTGVISTSNSAAELLWMYEPAVGPTPANWRVST